MIVWSGWGFLAVVIAIAGAVIGQIVLGDRYGIGIGFLLAAAVNFMVGRKLNNPSNDKIVVDEQTGERIALKSRSTLFFIPMEYWSILLVGVAVISFLGK